MSSQRLLNTEALLKQLKRVRRRGARASRILQYTPELVEMLYPATMYPDLDAEARSMVVEHLIRQAVDVIGGDEGHALAITLGLLPGLMGMRLNDRRKRAAEYMGVTANTWRRGPNEGVLFYDLAVEINRLYGTDPNPKLPARTSQ